MISGVDIAAMIDTEEQLEFWDHLPQLKKENTTDLFQWGDFVSHAGLDLKWKIECDAITDHQWEALAKMIMDYQTQPFYKVEGIPRGGMKLAEKLAPYASGNPDDFTMIVDDVYTTGTSFKEYIDKHHPDWLAAMGYKWVVFARQQPKNGVRALFTMPGLT